MSRLFRGTLLWFLASSAAPALLYVLDQMARVEVPAGELFVLGDNRDRSYDSRSFGTVSIWSVLGSVR